MVGSLQSTDCVDISIIAWGIKRYSRKEDDRFDILVSVGLDL